MKNIIQILMSCVDNFLDEKSVYDLYLEITRENSEYLFLEFEKHNELNKEHYAFYKKVIMLTLMSNYYEYWLYRIQELKVFGLFSPDSLHISSDIQMTLRVLLDGNVNSNYLIEKFLSDENFSIEIMTILTEYPKINNSVLSSSCESFVLRNKNYLEQIRKINPIYFVQYDTSNQIDDENIIMFWLERIYLTAHDEYYFNMDEYIGDELNEKIDKFLSEMDEYDISVQIDREDYDGNNIKEIFIMLFRRFFETLYENESDRNAVYQYIIFRILHDASCMDIKNIDSVLNSRYFNIMGFLDENYNNSQAIVEEFFDNEIFRGAIIDLYVEFLYESYNNDYAQKECSSNEKVKRISRINPFKEDK